MFSSGALSSMNTGLHAVEDRMRRIDQLMRSVEVRQSQMNNPVNLPEDPAAMPLSQRLDMPKSPIFSSFLQPDTSADVASPGAVAVHTGTSRLGHLPDVSQIDVDGLLLDRPVSIAPPSSASKSGSLRLLSGETALQPLIMSLSQKYGMDSRLISAIVAQESNFNPNAVSRSGAQGLMQLMPATAKSLGVTNSTDPVQNLDGGIRYFKSLMTQFKGNVPLALAAYNAGPNAVRQAGGIPHNGETQHYVRKILSNYLGGQ